MVSKPVQLRKKVFCFAWLCRRNHWSDVFLCSRSIFKRLCEMKNVTVLHQWLKWFTTTEVTVQHHWFFWVQRRVCRTFAWKNYGKPAELISLRTTASRQLSNNFDNSEVKLKKWVDTLLFRVSRSILHSWLVLYTAQIAYRMLFGILLMQIKGIVLVSSDG